MLQRRQDGRVVKIVYDDGTSLDIKYNEAGNNKSEEKKEEPDEME
jgi:hypothetical protein